MTKKKVLVLALIACLVVGGGAYILTRPKENTVNYSLEKAISTTSKSKKDTEMSSSNSKTSREEALATLETQTKVSDSEKSEVSNALDEGFEVLNTTEIGSDVKNDYSSHLGNSTQEMLKITVLALKAGYIYDNNSLEVYKSDNSGVVQFVFEMKKDGAENISFAGNYVQSTRQIEIANQHGTIAGVASPDGGSQSN